MKRSNRFVIALLLLVVMLAAAGCQAVGNVDLNRVLTGGLELESYEGQLELSIALDLEEKAVSSEELDQLLILKGIDGVRLVLDEIKQQDRQTSSVAGTLHTPRGAIPFQMSTAEGQVALRADGALKPIALKAPTLTDGSHPTEMLQQLGSLAQTYNPEFQMELTRRLVEFIVPHLPNPKQVTAVPDELSIRGETVALHRIHTEIGADEMRSLLQQFLQNVLDDEEGLQQLVGDVIELVAAQPDAPAELAENREFIALFAANMLHGWLLETSESLKQGESPLGPASSLTLTLYADEQGFTRKSEGSISMVPNAKTASAVKAVRVSWADEYGKLNKPVQATPVEAGEDALILDADTKAYRLLETLNPSSVAYRWLKEDLRITRKNIRMPMGDGTRPEREGILTPFIKGEGVTMVPARFVSEQLDADIEWNGEARQVRIDDPQSGRVIVLTIDSRNAVVDGQPATLEEAAEIVHGSTYVPVRFIAEQLGATVGWDGTTRTVSIIKE